MTTQRNRELEQRIQDLETKRDHTLWRRFRLNTIIITSSQLYKRPSNLIFAEVELVGGGGGGGGARGSASTRKAVAGGGGGGEYAYGFFSAEQLPSQIDVTIGAGGAGGDSLGGEGTDGGTSSFGSLMTARGGSGGFGESQGVSSGVIYTYGGGGGSGGTGGSLRVPGESGQSGFAARITYESGGNVLATVEWGQGGKGGNSAYGWGSANVGGTGAMMADPAVGYGAGGGGALATGADSRAGAAGTAGVCVIREFLFDA